MEEETPIQTLPPPPPTTATILSFFSQDSSDLDFSFTSTTSTSSTFTSSARSSLSLPSFSTSTSLITPLPHNQSDPHWSTIRAAANLSRDGTIHLKHLHLLRHLGSGHLAKVFHCRLRGYDSHDFALKVIDLDSSSSKLSQVRTEARVLASLDHPFLPTLYARLDASHYACFLIDYCSGGDLHSLLTRHRRLPLPVVKFLAAEVLLALEYLHSLGYVYRDLKPENVLIRSNGHIMLSDFDLCFHSDVSPSLYRRRRRSKQKNQSCFSHSEKMVEELDFVAEPEAAFSRACVGTHEYLAPEIVSGNGHGNGVDWWAFGVFVYELLYGKTPFKGLSKEETLKNIIGKGEVWFGDSDNVEDANGSVIRDLVGRLLVRDPKERLGSKRGAAEIKRHPFFEGVRWSLIRSEKSPVVVGPKGAVVVKGLNMEGKRRLWSGKWRSCIKAIIYFKGVNKGGLRSKQVISRDEKEK